jgi:hypothetical protein
MDYDFSAFIGVDGFIDYIFVAVDRRFGLGDNFRRIGKIQQSAKWISHTSGKSANIEFFPIDRRVEGNSPILA